MHELTSRQVSHLNEIYTYYTRSRDKFNQKLKEFVLYEAQKTLNPNQEDYEEKLKSALNFLRRNILQYALRLNHSLLFIWVWSFYAKEVTYEDLVTPVEKGPNKGKTAFWVLASQIEEQEIAELFLDAWDTFTEITINNIMSEPIAKINILWLLARGAKKNPKPFSYVWNDVRSQIPINVLRFYPETGIPSPFAGISAIWLLAQAESQNDSETLFHVISGSFEDEINQEDPINYDYFLAQARDGLHQGLTALYWLALAAAKGKDKAFLKVHEMFPSEMKLDHLRVKSKEGCSALFWLAVAAKNGKRGALSEIWLAHKNSITLADLTTCSQKGNYKDSSIQSLLKNDPVFGLEIEQRISELTSEEIVINLPNLQITPALSTLDNFLLNSAMTPQPFYGHSYVHENLTQSTGTEASTPPVATPLARGAIVIGRRK